MIMWKCLGSIHIFSSAIGNATVATDAIPAIPQFPEESVASSGCLYEFAVLHTYSLSLSLSLYIYIYIYIREETVPLIDPLLKGPKIATKEWGGMIKTHLRI